VTRRVPPGPGQESVWDYPRPAIAQAFGGRVQVVFGGLTIADSVRAVRTLETSHPPTYYIPADDVRIEHLTVNGRRSLCEWKGQAAYFELTVGGRTVPDAAWSYARPTEPFAAIAGAFAFYAAGMDACFVDGERVTPQPGGFYGGWITSRVVGPFKGGPGTMGW
jgi:uncharacterized protein (DUF427 family)